MLESNSFLGILWLSIAMKFCPIFSGIDPAECEGEETTTTTKTTATTTTSTTSTGYLFFCYIFSVHFDPPNVPYFHLF